MSRRISLDDSEEATLQRLVRQAIRKAHRNIDSLKAKFGDEYQGDNMEQYLDKLEGLYTKLGKDPDNIDTPDLVDEI